MKILTRIIKSILMRLPLGKYIVFESRPDFSDNSKYVYDEMVNRGLSKKYKFVWACHEATPKQKSNEVIFVSDKTKRYKYYLIRAKALISCNLFVVPYSDRQFSFFLGHGTAVKKVGAYYSLPESIQYCLASSTNTVKLRAEEFSIPEDRVVPLGFPRNDAFSESAVDLHQAFGVEYRKLIVWYPTFRQHIDGIRTDSEHAIPLLWNDDNVLALNQFCEEQNILVVIKPHFIQDMSFVEKLNCNRICFIDDKFFKENKIAPYSFLNSSDALLTDYSSVYFDYTLCDKPIGLIWEDYDEYKENPGFAVDMGYMMKGGEKLFTFSDLLDFLARVSNGTDLLAAERREIRDYVNLSADGSNSERVVDFIAEKAKL